jgi:hypothetical protein
MVEEGCDVVCLLASVSIVKRHTHQAQPASQPARKPASATLLYSHLAFITVSMADSDRTSPFPVLGFSRSSKADHSNSDALGPSRPAAPSSTHAGRR